MSPRGRDGLPAWLPRLLVVTVFTVLATLAGLWLLFRLRGLLVLLLVSLFLSFVLEPAVRYLSGRGWRRGWATAAVGAGLSVTGLLFLGVTLVPLVSQGARLLENLPAYLQSLSRLAEQRFSLELFPQPVAQVLTDLQTSVQGYAGDVLTRLFGFGSTLLGLILGVLTVALFTFYLVADGPRFRRAVLSVFPPDRQREILEVWEIAIDKTGGYIYSRLLLAALAAAYTWAALVLIGVPYPLALALWVGVVSQLLPAVGTYLAAVAPILVALIVGLAEAAWVLGALVLYQQIENYLLAPRIAARTMALHPAVAFGAAIAGFSILGVLGALIALPTAATVQAFVSTYLQRHQVIESGLTEEAETRAR
ncbi:MAG: AI-2E family transporter [Actinomycetota bacterium]|nr:AI-2E family transporter [Actinomycetota bacterium]